MTWENSDLVAFELSGHEGEFETGGGRFHVERSGAVPVDDIADLQRLWEELPEGEQSRCHNPRIGFEVRTNGDLELRAALCFECHNISTRSPQGDGSRTFDSSSKPARTLLKLLKAAL